MQSAATRHKSNKSNIYRRLAPVYDEIMKDVDYEEWTEYIDSIIQYHHPAAESLLELACGTGTMALMMERFDDYRITATDVSAEMIEIARNKAAVRGSSIEWQVQDMRTLNSGKCFDIIFMVFDSMNYLHEPEEIRSLLKSAARCLKENGFFIFDFTTPNFSPKVAPLLNGERSIGKTWTFYRRSSYNSKNAVHTNHFEVRKKDPETGVVSEEFEEVHRQKIWRLHEIAALVEACGLQISAAYEDFELEDATDNSDRITMVVSHG